MRRRAQAKTPPIPTLVVPAPMLRKEAARVTNVIAEKHFICSGKYRCNPGETPSVGENWFVVKHGASTNMPITKLSSDIAGITLSFRYVKL